MPNPAAHYQELKLKLIKRGFPKIVPEQIFAMVECAEEWAKEQQVAHNERNT